MTKNVWARLTFCAAILGATACGSSPRPVIDGDTGISIPDGGTGTVDSGGGGTVDSGGGGPVDSGGGGMCTLVVEEGNFGSLAPACLPRCAAATGTTFAACTTAACQQTALNGDTTPGVPFTFNGTAGAMPLNCAFCVQFQQLHCFSPACPTEVDDVVAGCLVAGATEATCNTAGTALNACIMGLTGAPMTDAQACINSSTGVRGCFGG